MKRNKFSLTNTKLASFNPGFLVPIDVHDILPGDRFEKATNALLRCSPLNTPVMHKVDVRVHHVFCPLRLVFDDFEDFITGGNSGNAMPVWPTITAPAVTGFPVGSLADYLGFPTGVPNFVADATIFRAYNLFYNEYVRDQDLMTAAAISTAAGVDTTTSTDLRRIAWEKDRFTKARPFTQRGTEVVIPITGNAPISGIGFHGTPTTSGVGTGTVIRQTSPLSNETVPATPDWMTVGGATYPVIRGDGAGSATVKPDVFADMSSVTAVDIRDLRLASGLQKYKEAMARWGARYVEYLRTQFGTISPDARLQRPELLATGNAVIQFSEVLQTAEGSNPVGELRGHGIAGVHSNKFRYHAKEHGFVITFISVRPKTVYMQGSPKMYNRRVKEDFYTPQLAHIGQQEIQKKEVYAQGTSVDDETFGYCDRYDEYRQSINTVAGEFRETTLDPWHMARKFSSLPTLNEDFVACNPTGRIFAVPSEDQLYLYATNKIHMQRPISASASSSLS